MCVYVYIYNIVHIDSKFEQRLLTALELSHSVLTKVSVYSLLKLHLNCIRCGVTRWQQMHEERSGNASISVNPLLM